VTCFASDFVFHNPRVHMRFFWNESTKQLAGVVHWDNDAEGPPSQRTNTWRMRMQLTRECCSGDRSQLIVRRAHRISFSARLGRVRARSEGAHGASVAMVFDEILAYPGE